jgi:hypothetical protein
MQELEQEHTDLALYWVSVSIFLMHWLFEITNMPCCLYIQGSKECTIFAHAIIL